MGLKISFVPEWMARKLTDSGYPIRDIFNKKVVNKLLSKTSISELYYLNNMYSYLHNKVFGTGSNYVDFRAEVLVSDNDYPESPNLIDGHHNHSSKVRDILESYKESEYIVNIAETYEIIHSEEDLFILMKPDFYYVIYTDPKYLRALFKEILDYCMKHRKHTHHYELYYCSSFKLFLNTASKV